MAEKAQETKTAPQSATNASGDKVAGGDGISISSGGAQGATEDPKNLNQIREILFGRQRDEFRERIEQLEEQLKKDATELQKDFEARLESMEEQFAEEARKITDRLEAEAEKRTKALEELTTSLEEKEKALAETLEEKTAQVEQELKDRSEALQADLEKHATRLTSEKANREDLAAFFAEISERLSKDS